MRTILPTTDLCEGTRLLLAHVSPASSTHIARYLPAILSCVALCACRGGGEAQARSERSAPVAPSPDAAETARAPLASAGETIDLDGLKVRFHFPGFRMIAQQSDPASGLAAFASERPEQDRTASLFLDGTRSVTLPKSGAEALDSVVADEACQQPGDCTELNRAALPGGGLLITVKKPHAVYTETWRRNAQHRVVRCGAELSEPVQSAGKGAPGWLHEPARVRAAQVECEALCRSVVPLPQK